MITDFYKEICATTKVVKDDLPARATVEIYIMEALELIIENWRIMVRISALSGYKQAYIGIFQKSFKIRERIKLYDYFNMNDEAKELFRSYDINILEDQILEVISPFGLEMIESEDEFAIIVTWE